MKASARGLRTTRCAWEILFCLVDNHGSYNLRLKNIQMSFEVYLYLVARTLRVHDKASKQFPVCLFFGASRIKLLHILKWDRRTDSYDVHNRVVLPGLCLLWRSNSDSWRKVTLHDCLDRCQTSIPLLTTFSAVIWRTLALTNAQMSPGMFCNSTLFSRWEVLGKVNCYDVTLCYLFSYSHTSLF